MRLPLMDPHIQNADHSLANYILDPGQLRVVVMQDVERKNDAVLFDSLKNQEVQTRKPCSPNVLGENMFGSAPFRIQDMTSKVHVIPSLHLLMFSKVFIMKNSNQVVGDRTDSPIMAQPIGIYETSPIEARSVGSLMSSLPAWITGSVNIPQNHDPAQGTEIVSSYLSNGHDGDQARPEPTTPSLFAFARLRSTSATSTPDDYAIRNIKQGVSSYASDNGFSDGPSRPRPMSDAGDETSPLATTTRQRSDSTFSGLSKFSADPAPELEQAPQISFHPIGLAVVFTHRQSRELQSFLFHHYPLFEARISALVDVVIQQLQPYVDRTFAKFAKYQKSGRLHFPGNYLQGSSLLNQIVIEFNNSVRSFMAAPRLPDPVWYHMINFPTKRQYLSSSVISALANVAHHHDHRKNSYIISGAITAILTYHLGWLSSLPSQCFPQSPTHDVVASPHLHLYQIFGGSDERYIRIIVCGADAELVRNVLCILSYFIRYPRLLETSEELSTDLEMLSMSLPPLQNGVTEIEYPQEHIARKPFEISVNSEAKFDCIDEYAPEKPVEEGQDEALQEHSNPNSPTPARRANFHNRFAHNPSGLQTSQSAPVLTSLAQNHRASISITPMRQIDLGRTLLGGYHYEYVPDLLLHGVPKYDFFVKLVRDMQLSLQPRGYFGDKKEANCIILDLNESICEVVTCYPSDARLNPARQVMRHGMVFPNVDVQRTVASDYIRSVVKAIEGLWNLQMPPDVISMHVEDSLAEVVSRAKLVSEYLNTYPAKRSVPISHLAEALGFKNRDMPLYLSVARHARFIEPVAGGGIN
eukprot:TRINITY_DN8022_c0_g1_i1.p1 TRINITY_DN8022_c0_g1~~TRINITY_DN8022_c0_g1_i1.p1  ORF type:complete len:810 (-),score=141.44 TRINITY_DN8022_c0_g1_i1:137-2566(-)